MATYVRQRENLLRLVQVLVDGGHVEMKRTEPARTLHYSAEKPKNPWESGWRSWVMAFAAEFIVQILGPLLVFLGTIWLMSKLYGK